MPHDTPTPAAPEREGTSLWNIQTQAPEWVPLHEVKSRLASGTYKSYSGSDVALKPGTGGEGQYSPEEAATQVEGGTTVTHGEDARNKAARGKAIEQAYDNAGDKALAVADGFVSGLSGGLLEGVPGGSKYEELEAALRTEHNPGYKTLGELAAIAATVLAPASALKYTPLGASNLAFEATSKAVVGKLGQGIIKKGIADATGGAVAAAALSSAHAVGEAVRGKPVSGYALVDDIGLGAVLGFGVGAVAESLLGSATKAAKVRSQIEAAARFDESALPVRATLTDVSKSWNSAHNVADARFESLDDLVKSGMLDAELPGTEWLAARAAAKKEADAARTKLHKIAGTDDPAAIGARLHDLAVAGKAKEAQKLYQAFDEYGTAVSKFDDAMQPTTFDNAHLGDVIGDIDLTIPAADHPLQRLEQMIKNGTPEDEIARFVDEFDAAYNKNRGGPTQVDDVAPKMTGRDSPGGRKGAEARAAKEVAPDAPVPGQAVKQKIAEIEKQIGKPIDEIKPGDPWSATQIRKMIQEAAEKDRPARVLKTDINAPTGDPQSTLLGGSRAGFEKAGFNAKNILESARVMRETGVTPPVRPTALGDKIQGLLDELTAATGNRLGSPEARALATKLGMNLSTLQGPVSSRLADLWSLHRMSEALADHIPSKGKKPKNILTKALGWGAVSAAGATAYGIAGAGAAGTTRSLARQLLGATLYGTAAVTAAAGRFKQSAINGLSKALNPTGKRLLQMGSIYAVTSAAYAPEEKPTTSYHEKAKQLRWIAQNPEPAEARIKEAFKWLEGIDPMAAVRAKEAAMTRLKNLAKNLPESATYSVMTRSRGPTQSQIQEWEQYEAVTSNRELVFKYLKSGMMPRSVVAAMNEQHPDYMEEIRTYILNNPEEVQAAPFESQMALSKLLGVYLVPEANPAYVKRMQEPYSEAKEKAAQNQIENKGATALRPPMMTPGQMMAVPIAR